MNYEANLAAAVLWLAASAPLRADDMPELPIAEVPISEWQVPWEDSRPRDPYVDLGGRVWFAGELGNYIASLTPETGAFSRYDLPPKSEPHSVLVAIGPTLWFAAPGRGYIGHLDPATGHVIRLTMPERDADDPYSLAFDNLGNIWFAVERGNYVGKLDIASASVQLIEAERRRTRPCAIAVNSRNEPWVAACGRNLLLRVDPDRMTLDQIELPERKARPRRLTITSDDRIWWTDAELGLLGSFDPQSSEFASWPMPGGKDSVPNGIAVDRRDRLWIVETGLTPNRFVGFDTANTTFFSITAIPSGGDNVRSLHYYAAADEIWFGTDSNFIGRASVR